MTTKCEHIDLYIYSNDGLTQIKEKCVRAKKKIENFTKLSNSDQRIVKVSHRKEKV